MTTYYVDATSGNDANSGLTEALAWKTISKVNSAALVAGDYVRFKRGETFVGRLIPNHSGTDADPIVYSAYGTGDRPIIDGRLSSPLYINNATYHHLRYHYLDFYGSVDEPTHVVRCYTHDVYFYDCIMRDGLGKGFGAWTNTNTVYNITLENCVSHDNFHSGFYIGGDKDIHDCYLLNCTAYNNGDASNLAHGFYTEFGTIVDGCTSYNNYEGGFKMNDNDIAIGDYYPIVRNSTAYGNRIGLILTHLNAVAYNNVFYSNTTCNLDLYANSDNNIIYYNTFVNSTNASVRGIRITVGPPSGCIIKNNIFVQDAAVVSKSIIQVDAGTMANLVANNTWDYNVYYYNGSTSGHIIYQVSPSTYYDWTEWKAAGADPHGTHLSTTPDFVARYTDLHPATAGDLIGTGVPIVGYAYDKDGYARDSSTPTAGAYETTGEPSPSISPSRSPSASYSASPSVSASASPSSVESPSLSPSASITPTASKCPSASKSPSASISTSVSPSLSPSASASPSLAHPEIEPMYMLRIYNTVGVLRYILTDFISLSYIRRVNNPGVVQFVIRGDHPLLSDIEDKWQVEVWRRSAQNVWMREITGIYRLLTWAHGDQSKAVIFCNGLMSMLAWRTIAWTAGYANRSKFINVNAETAANTMVKYNCTSFATVANGREREGEIPGMSVEDNGFAGNAIDWFCAYDNLLDSLKELANVGGGDFDLVKTSNTTWQFRWYEGQLGTDRSSTVVFSLDRGNMANPVYQDNRTQECTAAIVGGKGEGADRAITTVTGNNYNSITNNIEIFVDATDVDTADGRATRGDQKLAELQAVKSFNFDVLQIPSCTYGVTYTLGDLVKAINPFNNDSYTVKVQSVSVSLSENGAEKIAVEMSEPL